MFRLRANVPALAAALSSEHAAAGVAAFLRSYEYARAFASSSAAIAQIASAQADFGDLFERVGGAGAGAGASAAASDLAAPSSAGAGGGDESPANAHAAVIKASATLPAAASCEQEAAVLMLASELECVAALKTAVNADMAGEIRDLFFRVWATSVSEIQPALRAIIAPEPGSVEDLLGGVIKQIINKE